jgi:hypothetical protein
MKSNNLTVKLLNTFNKLKYVSETSKKNISNLSDLSNRLKLANKNYNFKRDRIEDTTEWIKSEGV